MSFVDDVLTGAKSVAEKAGDKAANIYDISKVKLNGVSLKNDLDRKYYVYGKAIYHNAPQEVIDNIKDKIDDIVEQIKENNMRLKDLQSSKQCPVCGSQISQDDVCPICDEI